MASGRTIIVGGGISAGSPFTLKAFMYVGNTDPPTALSSPLLYQVTGANPAIIVSAALADPEASAASVLRVVGGIASFPNAGAGTVKHMVLGGRQSLAAVLVTTQDSTLIGNDIAVTSLGSGSTLVGDGITSATTAALTAIGQGITVGSAWVGTMIAIGAGVNIGNSGGANPGNCIFIGDGLTVSSGGTAMSQCTVIGYNASLSSAGGSAVTAVGALNSLSTSTHMAVFGRNNSISGSASRSCVLGVNNTINHSDCIVLGGGVTTTAAGQCWIGGPTIGSIGITTVIVGKGDTDSAPSGVTVRLTNGSGTNVPGGSLTVVSGAGTGNAAASSIVFQTPTVGGSGAVAQVLATRLTVATAAITATVPVIHPAGAVGAPSISFTQANTGLYEAAAGTVSVSANGVESLRVSGGGAGEVNILVFDVTAAALRRVSIGANDSGGAGFRVLRIPN